MASAKVEGRRPGHVRYIWPSKEVAGAGFGWFDCVLMSQVYGL